MAALLIGGLIGCGQDAGSGVAHTVRDSAGVRLIEHELPPSGRASEWRLAADPIAVIEQDEADPERVWTRTRDVAWLPNDRIGVLVSDPPYLRVFSTSGEPELRMGRQGSGPGELRGPTWLGTLGDSIVVRDGRGLSVYDPAGDYVRTILAPGENWQILGPAHGGWIAVTREVQPDDHSQPAPAPEVSAHWTALLLTAQGELIDTIAEFEQLLTWRVQASLWESLRHAATDGDRVHVMDSNAYEVRTYEEGALTRIVRAPIAAFEAFTEAHFEVTREVWGAIADRMIRSDREAGRLIVPPAISMLVDSDARLWIRRTDDGPAAAERVWDVFSADGAWTATLSAPPQLSIREIVGDRVLGIWTNEFDVTSVRVYEVASRVQGR
jgi:hypothetical protein